MNMMLRKTYAAPPVCEREILRYAGCSDTAPDVVPLLRSALAEALPELSYTVCCREFPVSIESPICHLGFAEISSAGLARNLEGCRSVVMFAATVGLALDRLIARYGRTAPAKALMLQAIGAERIEALCDVFCRELAGEKQKEGLFLRPRFSPGYGDLPLSVQQELFSVLDCPRQIGLTLNRSMLMSPSKSVTAIVGITPAQPPAEKNKCSLCTKQDCSFRSIT